MHRFLWSALGLLLVAVTLTSCEITQHLTLAVDSDQSARQLVFHWKEGGRSGLAVIATDGSGFRWLPGGERGLWASWSPDGKSILFAAGDLADPDSDSPTEADLYLYDIATRTSRSLGKGGPPFAWREDSQRFAAIRKSPSVSDRLEVVVFTPAGAVTLEAILPFEETAPFPPPIVWLPGTDTLAMIGKKGDNWDVYLVQPGEVRQLTTTGDVVGFGFSASSRRLIWARESKAPKQSLLWLHAYDLPSRTAARLPFRMDLAALNPDSGFIPEDLFVEFSPDGSRLVLPVVLKRSRQGQDDDTYWACYAINLDGSDLRLIRRGQEFLIPLWTRDSRQLVIWVLDDVHSVLKAYNADGTGGRTLRITRTPFIEVE